MAKAAIKCRARSARRCSALTTGTQELKDKTLLLLAANTVQRGARGKYRLGAAAANGLFDHRRRTAIGGWDRSELLIAVSLICASLLGATRTAAIADCCTRDAAASPAAYRPIRLISTRTAVSVTLSRRYGRGRGGFGGQERSHVQRNTSRFCDRAGLVKYPASRSLLLSVVSMPPQDADYGEAGGSNLYLVLSATWASTSSSRPPSLLGTPPARRGRIGLRAIRSYDGGARV